MSEIFCREKMDNNKDSKYSGPLLPPEVWEGIFCPFTYAEGSNITLSGLNIYCSCFWFARNCKSCSLINTVTFDFPRVVSTMARTFLG